jgi:hypothetical protein
MKDFGGAALLFGGIGLAAYLWWKNSQNVTTPLSPSSVPITSSGPLPLNCPGDPTCPGNTLVYGPTDEQLGI